MQMLYLVLKLEKNKVNFGRHWNSKAYSTKTKECYDGKTYVNITDMFRAYDSVEDYYDMLGSCTRYAKCVGITAIKNGGYATSQLQSLTIHLQNLQRLLQKAAKEKEEQSGFSGLFYI